MCFYIYLYIYIFIFWTELVSFPETIVFESLGKGINHRKDVKKPDAILTRRLFQETNQIFNKQAMFIIIDKLTNTAKSKDILRRRLIERENFWIQTLETLHSK